MDEAEKNQLTFEEYKRQQDELKRLAQEKVPALKPRVAGEGEDPKAWKKFEQVYRKKNDDDASEDEEEEEGEYFFRNNISILFHKSLEICITYS